MIVGEVRQATEVGFKTRGHKVIWFPCSDCGKERWVFLKNGKPGSMRCRSCSSKMSITYLHNKPITKETRLKKSLVQTGRRNPMFGKHHSEETKEKMRQSKLALYEKLGGKWWTAHPRPFFVGELNPNYRGGGPVICDSCGAEIPWRRAYRIRNQRHHFCNFKCMGEWQANSREFLLAVMSGAQIKPNLAELALLAMIQKLLLPYSYVGDGQFILGGKCPDFLNTNGQKKLIEFWGDFWHNGQNPQDRIDYFAQYGFETLIIWGSELDRPVELEERLLNFDAKRLGVP